MTTGNADAVQGQPEAVSTATSEAPQSCLHCGTPIAPARRGGTKLFCTDRHRAAYRDQAVRHAIQAARDAIVQHVGELARSQAAMEGALAQLDKFAHHGTKREKGTKRDLTTPGR